MKGFRIRRAVTIVCFAVLAAVSAYAADDALTRGTKLLERHHYNEALVTLRSAVVSINPEKQGGAYLALGVAYLRDAVLHAALRRNALAVSEEYLKKLAAEKSKSRSRYADLYLGEVLLEAGRSEAAAAPLEKFIADENLPPQQRDIARALLGASLHARGEKERADELWAAVNPAEPEVKTELALAFSRAGLTDRNAVALCDEALAAFRKEGKAVPVRAQRNALAVYLHAGLVDRALEVERASDFKTPVWRERIGGKELSFYGVSLFGDLSRLSLKAGITALEKAAKDASVRDAANFHLGEAYALLGDAERAKKALASVIAAKEVPQRVRDLARVREAAAEYQEARNDLAKAEWDAVIRKHLEEPELLEEALQACARLELDCTRPAKRAELIAAGQGRKAAPLFAAAGEYYLAKREFGRSLASLEAGRDKGNKNKIEPNDPVLLTGLADVYFRTKKYSEALEIYFEMGKQFPEVRILQEPLQGVYSMEQKSAGDARIN